VGKRSAERGGMRAPVLVFPGTCTYIFYQLGMTQYLAERKDLRGVKVAGTSSGAVCAGIILAFEEEPNAAGVRRKANEIFSIIETSMKPILFSPYSFMGRLGCVLEDMLPQLLPATTGNVADRFRIGETSVDPICVLSCERHLFLANARCAQVRILAFASHEARLCDAF
jgi:predicted acylesterase/phospholipase RssA